jgi:hypothetical protein
VNEKVLYPTVKKSLLELGACPAKIPGSTFSQGLPDFIATYKGRAVHIEVKIKKKKGKSWEVTELQDDYLRRHMHAGGICMLLTYDELTRRWFIESYEIGCRKDYVATEPGHSALVDLLRQYFTVKGV